MFGTAPEYRTVNGLRPDAKKHLIFADIEPVCSDEHLIEVFLSIHFSLFSN